MTTANRPFSDAEQVRFHALLKLAAESPFEGERANALAAATRFAAQHGMTLDEAARREQPPDPLPRRAHGFWQTPPERNDPAARAASFINLMESYLRADKARREAALREAMARGLDMGPPTDAAKPASRRRYNYSRRNPLSHAHVLLAETSLPLQEIVSLTGLDIYQVVGLKLKMRRAA